MNRTEPISTTTDDAVARPLRRLAPARSRSAAAPVTRAPVTRTSAPRASVVRRAALGTVGAALLLGAGLGTVAATGSAWADSPSAPASGSASTSASASPSDDASAPSTAAGGTSSAIPDAPSNIASASPMPSSTVSPVAVDPGTSFLTATAVKDDQPVTVTGSTGDYQYLSFVLKAGQLATFSAEVTLPPSAQRHGPADWELTLYDGLRREQPCVGGTPVQQAADDAATVQLTCTLPRIRSYADTWSNDPLPGTYYARLTLADSPEQDLGLATSGQLLLTVADGASRPAGASLPTPLVQPAAGPTATAAPADAVTDTASGDGTAEHHWYDGWFSHRHAPWWWMAGGSAAAAATAVLGFTLTRRRLGWFSS